MFGKNKIEKLNHGNGETLHVVKGSPFLTIQGEGPYAGHPAVFIRLHGCHLRCIFCDTNFDDPDDPAVDRIELINYVMTIRRFARVVVITGGEPMRQNILPLCWSLNALGFKVQIETSGTFWIEGIQDVAEIVCSPKTPTIHPMIYEHAAAFKYVISASSGFNDDGQYGYVPIIGTQPGAREARLATPREAAPVYLSPCDEYDELYNGANRKLVGKLAIEYGVIAGLQVHKYLEVD